MLTAFHQGTNKEAYQGCAQKLHRIVGRYKAGALVCYFKYAAGTGPQATASAGTGFRLSVLRSFCPGLLRGLFTKAAAKAVSYPGYRHNGPLAAYNGFAVYILNRGTLAQPCGYVFNKTYFFHNVSIDW